MILLRRGATLLSRVSLISLCDPYAPGGPTDGAFMVCPRLPGPDLGMAESVLGGRSAGSILFLSSLKVSSFLGSFPV